MIDMKAFAKKVLRSRWGKGLVVVTRSTFNNRKRLGASTFATQEAAKDFARRCEKNDVKVLGIV